MIIKLTIDRFENKKAILKTEDNETIIWPKNKLPERLNEGAALTFVVANSKKDGEFSKQLAKNILNEILNIEDKYSSVEDIADKRQTPEIKM